MKPSTLIFTAVIAALLAVSTTAWPFFHPPHFPFFPPHFPIFPPHPFFPFPPGGGSAPPPSSGGASVSDSDGASGIGGIGDMSTTNWLIFPPHFPFFPPHFPIFPPHPFFPFPPGGGSAPPPSSGGASVSDSDSASSTGIGDVSTTNWLIPPHFPFFPPHFPIFPPHPFFPFPPGGGSAPPPSSGGASVSDSDSASSTGIGDVSTTNWLIPPHFPFFPPHFPIFPPHPIFPFPPGDGSAPPPSSGSASVSESVSSPTAGEVKKCLKALRDSGFASCFRHKYDAGKCCTYITGLEDSCTYVPFYKSHFFHGKLKHVCDDASAPPSSPSS